MLQKIGALRTEFSIPSSKIFPEIEKYNPSSNYISYKKCCKKCGGISYRKHRSQFQNIFRDRKVEFLVQKYFLHKMLQKKRSFVQNSPFLVPIYIQRQENTSPRSKIFPIKYVAKKQWVCRTEFTVIIQNFRMKIQFLGDRKIQYKPVPKNFLQNMLKKYYKQQQNSALQNISYKNVATCYPVYTQFEAHF